MLPLHARTKSPAVDLRCPAHPRSTHQSRPQSCDDCISYTGYKGVEPSYADACAWAESPEYRDGNLSLRLPDGIVGIDVDAYGAKTGARTYAEAVRRWGPLPIAPRSSSRRGDLTSGIRLFRIPPGTSLETLLNFPDLGVGDVEIIQFHHRYAVTWPSIHPEGGRYMWVDEYDRPIPIPRPEELPDLPQSWVDGLRARPRVELSDVQIRYDVRQALTAGAPSTLVAERLRQAIVELNTRGVSRHDTCTRHVMALARLGKTGEAGVEHALRILCDVLIALRAVDGSNTADGTRGEFVRMLTNERIGLELSQPGLTDWVTMLVPDAPPEMPASVFVAPEQDGVPPPPDANSAPTPADVGAESVSNADATHAAVDDSPPHSPLEAIEGGFWNSRDSLRMIWQTAMAQMTSPWAVLGICAARALVRVRPNATLPPLVGGPGSLNFFVALVARSGGGKGAASAAADYLIPSDTFKQRNAGSGEGLVKLFDRPRPGAPGAAHNEVNEALLINVDEVDMLTSLGNRNGSTTTSVLCSAFSGETLDFSYVNRANVDGAKSHSYRMTLVMSVQPKRAQALLSKEGSGLPQRFMWVPASDPRIPRSPGWPSTPLTLPPSSEWQYPRQLIVPQETVDAIRENRVKNMRDELDALDGHALFCREKFAFALAVLDGRTAMTLEDWQLSEVAAKVSDYSRDLAVGVLREETIREAVERGQVRGVEMEASDAEKSQAEFHRAQRVFNWLHKKLKEAGDQGLAQGVLMEKCAGRDRRALSAIFHTGHCSLQAQMVNGSMIWSLAL